MEINSILLGVIIYFLLGSISLFIFDMMTNRIRTKASQAASETQSRLAMSGNYVGIKVAFILFISAMWLFWPAVFIGALTDKKEDSHGS